MVGSPLTEITTLSEDAVQGAFEMVQRKVDDPPMVKPVTPDVGDDGVVTTAEPDTTVQSPVPAVGVLPASVVVVELHKDWSGPAAAVVGVALTEITTSSLDAVHGELDIVQRNVDDSPIVKPVTPDVRKVGLVTCAVPEITVHKPVPTVGLFPASVVVVVLHRD